MNNSMQLLKQLESNGKSFRYYSFDLLSEQYDLSSLPFAAKILLENLLRYEHKCVGSPIS